VEKWRPGINYLKLWGGYNEMLKKINPPQTKKFSESYFSDQNIVIINERYHTKFVKGLVLPTKNQKNYQNSDKIF
jgi:hypothetical protein